MGLSKILCGVFNCQKFKDHDTKLTAMGTKITTVLAIVQAGMAGPLTWWIQDPGPVQGQFSLELIVKGSQIWEFKAYGADIVFDPLAMVLESVDLGDLNPDWTLEGENEISPGRWRFGAIPGTANPVTGELTGCISRFRFSAVAGFTGETEIRIENVVDDFLALSPQPLKFILTIE